MNTKFREIELSVVIPCYNEEEGISELVTRVCNSCSKTNLKYEILLVDDGSQDETWSRMLSEREKHRELSLVKLARNHGHQLALSAGLSVCKGTKYIFVLDADLQDPPELLEDMLEKMKLEQADVVYGQRAKREGESFFKLFTAKVFYRFLRMMTDVDIPADTGDFRLMKRAVVDRLLQMNEHARFIRGMVSWCGGNQVPFLYFRKSRFAGETKYPLKKMIHLAMDAIISFSVKPLRVGIKIGFLGGILGVLMLLYCLFSYFCLKTVAGWTSMVAIITILGSLQIFLLGVIGEYIGRIFVESQNRPLFLIQEVVSSGRYEEEY